METVNKFAAECNSVLLFAKHKCLQPHPALLDGCIKQILEWCAWED
jgi:hypothetical protein